VKGVRCGLWAEQFRVRRTNKNSKRFEMILRSLLLILVLIPPVTAQVKADKKFSKVPVDLRDRLIERINLYFEYERTQQYDKLYELISSKAVSSPEPSDKPSREDFVSKYQYLNAMGSHFVPVKWKVTEVGKHNGKNDHPVYIVWFDMKAQYGGRIVDKERIFLEAHFENGDWHFRSHHIET
jgi:hypothetical protein